MIPLEKINLTRQKNQLKNHAGRDCRRKLICTNEGRYLVDYLTQGYALDRNFLDP